MWLHLLIFPTDYEALTLPVRQLVSRITGRDPSHKSLPPKKDHFGIFLEVDDDQDLAGHERSMLAFVNILAAGIDGLEIRVEIETFYNSIPSSFHTRVAGSSKILIYRSHPLNPLYAGYPLELGRAKAKVPGFSSVFNALASDEKGKQVIAILAKQLGDDLPERLAQLPAAEIIRSFLLSTGSYADPALLVMLFKCLYSERIETRAETRAANLLADIEDIEIVLPGSVYSVDVDNLLVDGSRLLVSAKGQSWQGISSPHIKTKTWEQGRKKKGLA